MPHDIPRKMASDRAGAGKLAVCSLVSVHVRARSSRLRVVVCGVAFVMCDVVDLQLSACAAASGGCQLASEGPPAFVVPSQAPQLYGASCLPTAKLFSHCRRPRFTHRAPQCQFITASLVSDAVFFGCPWGSVRKPQCVLWMPTGPQGVWSGSLQECRLLWSSK